ncbi:hypothetical protein E3_0390 [Rhodococcus phage E3]|uniref:hypothetical protein n=1 Tax=Rhodococcus phage E3 TaxID=1007869 RepID=UPI0002C6D89F|nr:hypothetical protein M176_gp042 [Rhodococcus phage E3]AEQ20952.1 hypothetical protein E3_0390 [Rhodococcus phage E3]
MADERYTRFHLPASGEQVLTTVCKDCGAWAVDTKTHDEFHEELDRQRQLNTRLFLWLDQVSARQGGAGY